ncbi:unnamed protein product [Cyprideis torosa]|uniref:Uncharacterized protein n=1 Tax=Cyprideis torosa TaxID=163714 RepID=A0A7R8WEX2_9CRUS|nr:unnamed protein product [Cyprideis torosa]CAG0890828.1 unnamed protein product [Cyprideis torosa]
MHRLSPDNLYVVLGYPIIVCLCIPPPPPSRREGRPRVGPPRTYCPPGPQKGRSASDQNGSSRGSSPMDCRPYLNSPTQRWAVFMWIRGLAERYELNEPDEKKMSKLYSRLYRATLTGCFITCSKAGDWRNSTKADDTGLVGGHAYTITGVARLHTNSGPVKLAVYDSKAVEDLYESVVEVKSSQSQIFLLTETKTKLAFQKRGDGEFWMSFDDFRGLFEEVSLCTLGPDFDADGRPDKAGQVHSIHGAWQAGYNAGGSRNNMEKFATNPQYLLTLSEADDTDRDGLCSVLISLMQEYRRSERYKGVKLQQIGFLIYRAVNSRRLPLDHFWYHREEATSGTFINYREVTRAFRIKPGSYIVIPATFKADTESHYIIRIYADQAFRFQHLSPQ